MGDSEEELLLAMALSRSLHEEEEARARLLTTGRPSKAWQGRKNSRAEKKHRAMAPPTLLLQDPEKARTQTEGRVALLLSEAEGFPSTPPLPPSRLLESELSRKAGGPLWECSSLVGLSDPGAACVASSTLPALPWQTDQRPTQSTVLPCLGSTRAEAEETLLQERGHQGKSPQEEREDAEVCRQKESEALRDLLVLAEEGLTLTQWSLAAAQPVEGPGQEWVPDDAPRSHQDQSPEEKLLLGSCSRPFLLGSLAAAFKGMVNNPHLSDVQFQVDSGELFYAHLFVLYARCPPLMEVVEQRGFLVAEGGGAKSRRVLLSDVSGEAVGVFLSYLYAAEPFVPRRVLSEVATLATRFGVAELATLCGSPSWRGQFAVGVSGQEEEEEEEEERVEKFEELLKSIWVGEDEEDKAVLPEELGSENMVDEQELEEIYEFAATQRKAEEGRCIGERNRRAGIGACPWVEPEERAGPLDSSEQKGSLELEPSCLQVRNARQEVAVPGFLLGPQQDAEEQRPLGAASRRRLEALLEVAAASEELGEKSLLSASWGESLELFQQSCDGREPIDSAAGEEAAVMASSLEHLPASRSFSSDDSQGSLVVQAKKCPASPERRRGFCSDLSVALFSPALQEASGRPCRVRGQEPPQLKSVASSGVAAGGGAVNTRYPPASLPSSSSPSSSTVDLERGLVQMLDGEDDERCDQEKQMAEIMGWPSNEQEALGGMKCHLRLEKDIPCCQGMAGPLLGMRQVGQADAGGKKMLLPDASWLSHGGPNVEEVAEPGLTSSLGAQQPERLPTQQSAVTPSPQKPSLQAWLPQGHRSPACLLRDREAAADVVIVEDSEEETEAAPELTWGHSVLEVDLPVCEDDGGHAFPLASPEGLVAAEAGGCQLGSPSRSLLLRDGTSPGGSGMIGNGPLPHGGDAEEERGSSEGSGRRRRGFRDQDYESEVLPLSQRLSAPVPVHKTPDLVCQEREAVHPSPPTPVPPYSIMETPELKKELGRFGVRALPKKQMVLKLKEIFQYTHQRPDSKDEAVSSQPVSCRRTKVVPRGPTTAAAPCSFPKHQPSCPELPQVLLAGGCFRGSSGAGDQGQMAKRGCLPAGSGRLKSVVEGPVHGGQALGLSQKAGGLSGVASDTSVVLQSSSTEYETSVLVEEEEEDDIPASQSAFREAETLLALRQYIHSRPALCRQILLYQPFELAKLQSELKQNGIRIALGRLLEFLDGHCITFTTAETRREKQQQSGHQGKRRRRC